MSNIRLDFWPYLLYVVDSDFFVESTKSSSESSDLLQKDNIESVDIL